MHPMVTHPDWQRTVERIATDARDAMPDACERLDKALALVLDGCVYPSDDWGSAVVTSATDPGKQYQVNGTCACADTVQRGSICKHRLAWRLYLRATQALLATEQAANGDVLAVVPPTVPAQYIQTVHGKPFVRYAGLLAMAHDQGLLELRSTFNSVSETIAVATATAVFRDGRTFVEAADATPENVAFAVRPHFARLALTRAKARALRDALNIGLCSVEELD